MSSESSADSSWRHITPLTAGLWAEWEPRAISELMRIGVYRLCTGEEIVLPAPTQPVIAADATAAARSTALREYKEDVRNYNEALRRNDRAIGTIRSIIAEDQLQHIDGKTTPKEVWDALKEKHKDSHSGLAAYYIKIGILEKKYTEDENMHAHLSFIQMENRKLPPAQRFDDEFVAQIMLMSLPRESTWETLLVALLQSVTESNKLKTVDVVTRLMQEYRRLTGSDSPPSDSALFTKNKEKPSKGAKKSSRCGYCKYKGHTEDDCRKKKRDLERNPKGKAKTKTDAQVAEASDSESDSDISETTERAHLASVTSEFSAQAKQWEDGSLHVFLASEVVACLARSAKSDAFIDSGCTRHLSPSREYFNDATYVPLEKPISIHLGDSSVIKAVGRGTLQYLMDCPSGVVPASIPDALYVPDLAATLLSVSRFTDRKHEIRFKDKDCHVFAPSGRCVAAATKTGGGLYRLLARPMLSKEPSRL